MNEVHYNYKGLWKRTIKVFGKECLRQRRAVSCQEIPALVVGVMIVIYKKRIIVDDSQKIRLSFNMNTHYLTCLRCLPSDKCNIEHKMV